MGVRDWLQHDGGVEHKITEGGNTVVPAILALQAAGFRVSERGEELVAVSTAGTYVARDPVTLLGLVRLVEIRGWSWQASDTEIDATLERFGWTG